MTSSTDFPLLDRVAIITGSSRGIGRAIAVHLSTLGARVVINYVSSSTSAETLASEINSSPSLSSLSSPRAIAIKSDVSDPSQVLTLFSSAESAFPGAAPHILVTSAGVSNADRSSIAETSVEEFDRTFSINTGGTFSCIKEAAKRIQRGGGGRIITVSSSLAVTFTPGYGAYTASKAAVEALTRVVAKELKGTGITANCVAPGPVATDMFYTGMPEEDVKGFVGMIPMGRIGEPEDIAKAVGFLVADSGEWVNGQVIQVNGGFV